jgi:uncharacterized protein involved in exopolysaccharide biosynthesis
LHFALFIGDETLSSAEENKQSADKGAEAPIVISIAELGMEIWERRNWLAKVIGLGTLVAVIIALLTPNKYTSTAQLMPPDSQALSNISMLSALSGGSPIASMGGGLMSARTPAGTFIGILSSQTAQNDLINRFDLRRVYHCKLYIDARKVLAERTVIDEDKKSGIISISVTDRDPNRARDLAGAYVEELGKLVNKGSTSSARREREFLEQRLESIKSDLDASSVALSQFSSRNATMDPQKQGQSILDSAGKLQGELIAAQSELSGLKAMYADDNVRVRQAGARVDELQRQLRKMDGIGERVDGEDLKAGQFMPSIRKLPLLGVTYADLYRRMTMQEAIYETLTKQYELAKVQEAKEIPPVKILDEPDVPERKSSPHRSIIILLGFFLSAFAGTSWVIALKLWGLMRDAQTVPAE